MCKDKKTKEMKEMKKMKETERRSMDVLGGEEPNWQSDLFS